MEKNRDIPQSPEKESEMIFFYVILAKGRI